jgi:hypothetical protein
MLCQSRIAITCGVAMLLATSGASQESVLKPIGEIFASDASVTGAVQLAGAGMQVMSGSAVGAGQSPALLRLARGGDLRVCPRTSLSISSSHNGRDLMFGMNSGAVEADYSLAASADAIMTPDFRILLAGPGKFHVAIGSDAKGNTCVRPLANNTASVIVSELMGDGTYQVKPDEQVMFEGGKLANVYHVIADCGCPGPLPVHRAAIPVPQAPSIASLRKGPPPPSLSIPLDAPLATALASATTPAPAPAVRTGEVHVEVDAPFVFSAADPEPAPLVQIAQLKFTSAPPFAIVPPPPQPAELRLPPPPVQIVEVPAVPKKKSGFFGKVRSFFASVFR